MVRDMVHAGLAQVEMADAAAKYPAELSGGMRKRRGPGPGPRPRPGRRLLRRALVGPRPDHARRCLDDLLLRLKETFGMTLVVVTHELPLDRAGGRPGPRPQRRAGSTSPARPCRPGRGRTTPSSGHSSSGRTAMMTHEQKIRAGHLPVPGHGHLHRRGRLLHHPQAARPRRRLYLIDFRDTSVHGPHRSARCVKYRGVEVGRVDPDRGQPRRTSTASTSTSRSGRGWS
ncbi:MAG: hypothetical protein MZV64_33575 [Ignavibacteriales bacterium]|nr:hypothetical protein [Ignavibacteriales bacterium]